MKVNRIELPKTLTEKTALQFVGNIASVCVGKFNQFDADRCEKIGRKNLTESCGKPTRAWEFLPKKCGLVGKFNNLREWLEIGNYLEDEECYFMDNDFFIFHLRIPRMVRDHIKPHTTLSSLCESTRLGDPNKKVEYFFPEVERYDYNNEIDTEDRECLITNTGGSFALTKTHYQFLDILKRNYNRKEIWSRPLSDFVMGDMIIAGYRENWEHFCNVRTDKATQKETRWVAEQIKGFLNV